MNINFYFKIFGIKIVKPCSPSIRLKLLIIWIEKSLYEKRVYANIG